MATATQIKQFINQLGALAVIECNKRIASGKGYVLPSVCIAQSAIETGWGTAGIMVKANAYFGIKAGGSWTGAVYRADTWEVANGEAYNTTANFRAYSSLAESVTDYYDLIGNSSRYSKALSYADKQLSPRECITAIWAGGYATDTLYVEKIMSTITARNLTEFDSQIDGSTYVYQNFTFAQSDMLAGGYLITDSGRSINNASKVDGTINNGIVSLDWAKAIVSETNGSLTINATFTDSTIASDHVLYLARLNGDTPEINDTTMYYLDIPNNITVREGERIGFFIKRLDGGNVDLTNLTFEIAFETTGIGGVAGVESFSTTELAFFVKIE